MKPISSSLVLLCVMVASTNAAIDRLKEKFAWKEVDFAFPSEEARKEAIEKGTFIPENNLPLGLDVSRGRLFITVPRWKSGVASTLNYVNIGDDAPKDNKSPALIPYPNWEANTLPGDDVENKSSHIISTFRIRADACRRLWVMDTGLADILGSHKQYTSPKLMVYDLETDQLLRVYHLKSEDVKEDSFFANVIVDVTKDDCDNAYAYIPDLGSYGLVVYSWKDDDSWRIKHHYFHFDPLEGEYNVGGINFQWTDGLFSIALSPRHEDGSRTLYFHPLSSTKEFEVNSKIVQNKTIASSSFHEYKVLGFRGNNSQATASFIDEESGVMFYTQINKNAVGCWNSNKPFTVENQGIVAQNDETLEFVNDLKVCNARYLWVLSDKLPKFVYDKLNPDEINFRILNGRAPDLIKDTVCE